MSVVRITKVLSILMACVVFVFMTNTTMHAYAAPDSPNKPEMINDTLKKQQGNEPKDTKEEQQEPNLQPEAPSKWGLVGDFIKLIVALAFVVFLIYAVMKFLNRRNINYQRTQIIRNLGGLSLGTQKSVQLLLIEDRILVVGVGDDIQLIKEISDPKEVEALRSSYEEKQELAAATPQITKLLAKLKKTPEKEEQSFNDMFQDKIQAIKKERSEDLNEWKKETRDKK